MLSVESYRQIASYISEVCDYSECLCNNVENLAKADGQRWREISLRDVQDAAKHITATIEKIVNVCSNEVSDSVQASR